MCLSKSVALVRDGESGLLSLSDRRVGEIKSEDEVDEYSGAFLFKCSIMFVVFPDVYYDPTNPADH